MAGCGSSKQEREDQIEQGRSRVALRKLPLRGKGLIIIDPGHGGEDFGTHSKTRPSYQEKNLNLSTAKLLNDYLRRKGYMTLLTRTKDVFIPLNERAIFANRRKPDLFVSVHYNSAPNPKAEGVEVYYYVKGSDKARAEKSKRLAKSVLDQIIYNTKAKSRGVKDGNFAVIRETTMPAILIEGGFLTSNAEMQKIKDPAYLKKLAWGIAQGIDAYMRK